MKRQIKIPFTLLFLFLSIIGLGQDFWLGSKAKLEINKHINIALKQECRFNENFAEFNKSLLQINSEWEPLKFMSVAAGYRQYLFPEEKVEDIIIDKTGNRIFYDASFKYRFFDRLTFKLRNRYHIDTEEKDHKTDKEHYLRNKLTIDYKINSSINNYLSGELYYRFDDKNEFRRYRLTIGVETEIINNLDLDTFVLLQHDYNINIPETKLIIGFALKYKIKLKDIKHKKHKKDKS